MVGTSSSPRLYRVGHEYKLRCSVTGSPIPNVSWSFKECSNFNSCNGRTVPLKADYEKYSGKNSVTSDLSRVATKSGQFSCMACNDVDCQYSKVVFFVTDVEDDGFAMTGPERAMEGDHVKLTCKASVYNFTRGSMRWYKDSTEGEEEITGGKTRLVFKQISTKWSFGEELHFKNLSLADKGLYFCRVKSNSGDEEDQDVFPGSPRRHLGFGSQRDGQERQMSPRRSHRLRVISLEAPRRKSSNLNGGRTIVERPQDGLRLECLVSGRPAPRVFWRLNGELVRETVNTTRVSIVQEGQVLEVSYVSPADEGLYSCVAENKVGAWSSQEIVALRATVETETAYENLSVPVIVAVAVAVALVIVIVCVVKLCYDGRSRKRKVKASSAAAAARSPTGWKAPPTPPTPLPRLMTQYEMSPEEEIDPDDSGSVVDCRSVRPSVRPCPISASVLSFFLSSLSFQAHNRKRKRHSFAHAILQRREWALSLPCLHAVPLRHGHAALRQGEGRRRDLSWPRGLRATQLLNLRLRPGHVAPQQGGQPGGGGRRRRRGDAAAASDGV